jgi:hypothetical protein
MAQKPPPSGAAALGDLQKALATALDLAHQLTDDPLFGRLVAVFRSMPMEDRDPIVAILERETAKRLLTRATEKPVGQSTHLNPNARLYVRAHSTRLDKRHFDYDEMVIADVRAMRIASMIRYVPEIYEAWKAAIREAMDHVDEPTRVVAEELLHDVLASIADARAAEGAAEPADDPSDASERTRKS